MFKTVHTARDNAYRGNLNNQVYPRLSPLYGILQQAVLARHFPRFVSFGVREAYIYSVIRSNRGIT